MSYHVQLTLARFSWAAFYDLRDSVWKAAVTLSSDDRAVSSSYIFILYVYCSFVFVLFFCDLVGMTGGVVTISIM